MKTIPLTPEDIDLITFALRRLSNETAFQELKEQSVNLITYVEQESKRKD